MKEKSIQALFLTKVMQWS